MNKEKAELLKKMQEQFNGCPLFEGREKEQFETLENTMVTVDAYFKLSDYYAVVFEEFPESVFLSGGAVTDLLNTYGDDAIGVQFTVLPMVKTNSKRDFRPIRIEGFKE